MLNHAVAAATVLTCGLATAAGPQGTARDDAPSGAPAPEAAAATDSQRLDLRLYRSVIAASANGPLADAQRLAPELALAPRGSTVAQAQWHATHRLAPGWTLGADLLAQHTCTDTAGGGAGCTAPHDGSRINEAYAAWDAGGWAATLGKKVVSWDVGYGFRPNDVVQQKVRRTLLDATPEGRPVVQIEHFDARGAASLVWVNPRRRSGGAPDHPGAREGALAARGYVQQGALDIHLFARVGEHTRGSVGAALAWVAGDAIEWHASWRLMQRHDAWQGPAGSAVLGANPWRITPHGAAQQALVGVTWTGAQQHSLLAEAWHDGTAPGDAAWRAWAQRNSALASPQTSPSPAPARAANLAWQTAPFDAANLRRANLYVRAAWQPGAWTWTLDALHTPADGGRIVSAGVQWQGQRVKLSAQWRHHGGAAGAVLAQLPLRTSALVLAAWAF